MTTPRSSDGDRTVPWKVLVSAYCIPVMVVAQFAFLAAVPVLVLLVSTIRNVRSSVLRWLAILLGVVYATPYALWKFGPNPELSFSKDVHPAFATLIVAVSVVFIVAAHIVSRRASHTSREPTQEDRTVVETPEADLLAESIVTEKGIAGAVGILLAVALSAMAVFGFLVKQLSAPMELLYGGVALSFVVGLIWALTTLTGTVRRRKDSR